MAILSCRYLQPQAGHHLCDGALLDITDLAACQLLIERYQPDTIYHLAGVSFGPDAERDFAIGLAVNVGGFFNVVRAAARLPKPVVVVLISSAEVYGAVPTDQLPISELIPPRPINNYGLTKLLAEQVFIRFEKFPHLRPALSSSEHSIMWAPGSVPNLWFQILLSSLHELRVARPPTMLVGNLEARRDFSDVGDIVQGYRLAAENGRGVYNLCSGSSVRVRDVLDQLVAISGQSVAD